MRIPLLIVLACVAPVWSQAAAQEAPVGGWIEDYARMLQLTGQIPMTPLTVRPTALGDLHALSAATGSHAWRAVIEDRTPSVVTGNDFRVQALPSEILTFANTSRPWGWNDGAVWQGKAVTLAAQTGAQARWGPVTLTLAPLITYSANAESDLSPIPVPAGLSPYAYPGVVGGTLDAPQRFGTEPLQRLDWGNTNLRVDLGPVAVGLSHESMWWGPGRRNDILLTNNAPGFWHAHLSLNKPVSVGIGTVSGRWIWGSLRESAFFDTIPANDRRYMTGAAVAFVPRWAKGLELGAARLFLQTWSDPLGVNEILYVVRPVFKRSQATASNPDGEDKQDQVAAVFARWTLPASGLELYGEWAKGDHSADVRDLLVEPEHASAYLLGFQKILAHTPERTWRFGSEMILLGAPRSAVARIPGAGFFYVHHDIRQGYTQRGQVLGAGIGPGSSQLSVALDRFAPWGSAGISVFRTVYDNDRFFRQPNPGSGQNEVEPSVTVHATVFRGAWDFSTALTGSNLLNQWYIQNNDSFNLNVNLSARYHPARAR
jgi:hypothetical protein